MEFKTKVILLSTKSHLAFFFLLHIPKQMKEFLKCNIM